MVQSGLAFLKDVLKRAEGMVITKSHCPDEPVRADDVPYGPLSVELRGVYVILCELRDAAGQFWGRSQIARFLLVERLFWGLVIDIIPALSGKNNFALRRDWTIVVAANKVAEDEIGARLEHDFAAGAVAR